ncbi:hypothetical protein EYR36_005410 [Pleurotus pulmonarius]|nr:hypothetical protein EYR36_005410 [Pleurotus pulmonarius]KAF4590389.1 hypothetical protein EYR38_009688 [Pleurotus pulmonarius]
MANSTPGSRPSSTSGTRAVGSSRTLNDYQLGDSLGKGAFGQVYRALNWATGETVAIKEIQLSNIPKSELGEIMSEIDLLKNLNHPNIVKYKGFVKTREYLYIILEFCENGSLHGILKRFGKFPENLVAVYIAQVLEGLAYLHDQGVIHRDIKGANILTNKDGCVKLADFGVATVGGGAGLGIGGGDDAGSGARENAVVGSPYWMAPEVIEQRGATTASDIWSVGCLVIELLQGHPPYHTLSPMPALFRIVQDDCPPIPDGASNVVKDFLYACFQRDANLRVGARRLLKHAWIVGARRGMGGQNIDDRLEKTKRDSREHAAKAEDKLLKPAGNWNYDEAVLKVQEWNEALKSPSRPSKHPSRAPPRPVSPTPSHSHQSPSESVLLSSSASSSSSSMQPSNSAYKLSQPMMKASGGMNLMGGINLAEKIQPSFVLQPPEEQTDNWDDDFEEGISFSKLQALERTSVEDDKPHPLSNHQPSQLGLPPRPQHAPSPQLLSSEPEPEDNAQTIKPNRSPGMNVVPLPVARAPRADMNVILEDSTFNSNTSSSMGSITGIESDTEDYSDLGLDEDEEKLQEKVKDFKKKNSSRRGLFHPDDIKTYGINNVSPGPLSAPLPSLERKPSRPSLSQIPSHPSHGPASARATSSHSRSSSHMGSFANGGGSGPSSEAGSMGRGEGRRQHEMGVFGKYAEDEEEDYEDVFGKANGTAAEHVMQTLQLNTRLSNKSWLGDEDSDEEDPFAEIDEGFAEDDLEANLQRDKHARLCNAVNQLIDELSPSAPDFQLRDACDQLISIMTDTPEMQIQFVASHGMLAILEVLEGRCSRELIMKLLHVINMLVNEDVGFLESFCLIGGIPVMMGFTSKKYSAECRLEASHFIRLLCHTSVLTLQMFIACRGLKVLVDLLDEDYNEQTDLVVHALNGIGSVFELQSPTTKNDFCRMFIRDGLLDPLSAALLNVMGSREGSAAEMKLKIIQILLVFSQVSQSDIHVRNAMGTRKIIRRLLRACELLEPDCLVLMLKAVKHLSMNVTLLDVLQNANAIEILTRILDEQSAGAHSAEMANHIFQTCYNLCRLNKSRQEEAAQAGIIPCLRRVIETSSPLKQFALPILCDLASAGKSCRMLLWQQDGLGMYLKLLDDPYFQVSALEAIVSWLQDEPARIEDELVKPEAVEAVLKCFVSSKANSFENLLEPFLKLTRLSSSLANLFAKSTAFFNRIIDRLSHHNKAVVRRNLLRILKGVCDVHPNRGMIVERYGLYEVVERLSRTDGAVLVRELAREIIPSIRPALRPAVKKSGSGGREKGVRADVLRASSRDGLTPKKMRRTASETSASPFESASPAMRSTSGGPTTSNATRTVPPGVQTSSSRMNTSRQRLDEILWQTEYSTSVNGSSSRRLQR